MSLGIVLGAAGAVIGGIYGGPQGAMLGWAAGNMLGNLLDPPKTEVPNPQRQYVQMSQYGSPIPMLFGTDCFTGTVIWQKYPFTEHGEKSGGKNTSPAVSSKTYSTSFAVLLCEGEIDRVEQIFADGRLWWPNEDNETPFTLYMGTETQLPDPTMEAELGEGNVPGYRGWAYVVFNELMLKDFGERIPQMKFVVAMKGQQNGAITQVASEEADEAFALYPRVTNWPITVGQELPEPSVTTDPYYYAEDALGAHRLTRGATYRYANGTTVDLWQDFCTPTIYCPVGGLDPAEGPWPYSYTLPGLGAKSGTPLGGTDICHEAGVEPGRLVESWCTSQDGTILVVITLDSIGGSDRQWHRIINGVVTAEGEVDDGLVAGTTPINIGCGGGGDNVGSNTVKGVVESNGEWIWTVRTNGGFYTDPEPSVNQQSVALFRIDSGDQTLKQYDAGSTEDSFGGPSQSGAASGAIYCPKDGYCATIIGGHTQYALYTRLAGGAASTLAEVINRISAKTPLDPSEYDTTLCEPILIDGGRVTGQMEAANALQPWRQAYFADASETNGVVRWVPRGGDVVGTFTTADLAARPDGDAPPAVIERERKTPIELARRVTVTFTDKSFDYQDGAVASDERQVGEAKSDTTVGLAIVLPPSKAKQVAKTLLWADHAGQVSKTWYTSFKHLKYEPTDVVTLPDGKDVRIDNKRILANNIIEFTGVETGGRIYVDSESEVAEGSVIPPQSPPAAKADAKLILIDGPLRSDADGDYAIKAAVGPSVPGKTFTGGNILMSSDSGASWSEIASISGSSTIGATTTALGAWDGGYRIDYLSRVQVELDDPSIALESVSEEGLYNGANLCLIGAEYLQFATATLIEEGVYELSKLLRGRKGTEQAASGHAAGELFVMLDTCIEVPLTSADLGLERQFKAVASGKSVASATTVTFTNSGVAMRCYAPGPVTGGALGNDDVRIDWIRRTRRDGEWRPFVEVPIGEATEKYVIEIWNAAYTECARVEATLTSPTFLYTSAMQTTDFGAPQEWVYGRVAQIGITGAGMFQRFRVRGAGATEDDPSSPTPPYITWPTQPTPPTPSGPTPAVDYTITTDNNNLHTTGFTIGQRLVFKFHTRTSPAVTAGRIGIAEYGDPPYFRSAKVSTDAKGLSVVYEAGGVSIDFNPIALSANTDYYLTLETAFGFGNPSGSIGAPCNVVVYLSDILS